MNHRLHLRLEQLERATETLLQSAESLGAAAGTVPPDGGWSAAQVVQHLVVVEGNIVRYLRRQLASAEQLRKAGPGAQLRSWLLRLLLRLPGLRFKAPAQAGQVASATEVPALPALRQQWAQARRELEQILNEFPGNQLTHAIFKHPRSGMLTIYQTLDFMLDHVLHHQQQLRRIEKRIRSTKP